MVLALVLSLSPLAAAQWTVGVYMPADNDMDNQANVDLDEMKQVGSTSDVNVVVQVDRPVWDPLPGCHRYFVKKGGVDTLADLGQVDMAAPATLADFAGFLRSRYPAANYMLVLWDHGDGWYPGYGPSTSAIFIDDSYGHEMGVAGGEFAQAMAGVKQALGRRVTILALDACLMDMVEVADEIRDDCDYMLASEALVPTGGYPYDKLLDRLASQPTAEPSEFLPGFCSDYVESYPGQRVELSALGMPALAKSLDLMSATVRDSIDAASPAVSAARAGVQTMPGYPFHADLIDFLSGLAGDVHFPEAPPMPVVESLRAALRLAVVVNERSSGFEHASGPAIWFPDNYLAFKNSIESYLTLRFALESGWPQFLNRYFGSDDIRPVQPVVTQSQAGGRNDVRLWWESCFDLSPVRYCLFEVTEPQVLFTDYCNDFTAWTNLGWTTSTQEVHSGQTSFFSGSADNLANSIESAQPLNLPEGGLLSFYAWYSTQEDWDSLTGFLRDICYVEWSPDRSAWHGLDSLYGDDETWNERRYLLPAGAKYLRFRYVSNAGINRQGVFIDDIKVYSFGTMRTVAEGIPDTTAYVFGVPHDTLGYYYFVTASDSFGNISMASQFYNVEVKTWAEPYTRPAPFSSDCKLVLDFPAGETTDVRIYTLSGTLVRRFDDVTRHVLDWDGDNAAGKPLADGLYLVAVQSRDFKKLGKIAKVARE